MPRRKKGVIQHHVSLFPQPIQEEMYPRNVTRMLDIDFNKAH